MTRVRIGFVEFLILACLFCQVLDLISTGIFFHFFVGILEEANPIALDGINKIGVITWTIQRASVFLLAVAGSVWLGEKDFSGYGRIPLWTKGPNLKQIVRFLVAILLLVLMLMKIEVVLNNVHLIWWAGVIKYG